MHDNVRSAARLLIQAHGAETMTLVRSRLREASRNANNVDAMIWLLIGDAVVTLIGAEPRRIH
jgi:hypothetical protein